MLRNVNLMKLEQNYLCKWTENLQQDLTREMGICPSGIFSQILRCDDCAARFSI